MFIIGLSQARLSHVRELAREYRLGLATRPVASERRGENRGASNVAQAWRQDHFREEG